MARILVKCEDPVVVTCYGQTETWERKGALEFFLQGMECSEGAEQERYVSIYCQLIRGAKEASDE